MDLVAVSKTVVFIHAQTQIKMTSTRFHALIEYINNQSPWISIADYRHEFSHLDNHPYN